MKLQLFNDDYLNVLDRIPNKSVDLILTDPPYMHVKGGMKSPKLNVGVRKADSEVVTGMSDFNKEKIYQFLDAVKPKMKKVNIFVFCSKLQIVHYLNWAVANKLQYDVLFWYKNTNRMISTKFFAPNVEYIIRIYGSGAGLKAVKDINGKAISDYYQKLFICNMPKNKVYEAQKPLDLVTKLLLVSSNKGDIVFDPFMGSGTTGVACVNTDRHFIGVEINDRNFNLAKERIGVTDED